MAADGEAFDGADPELLDAVDFRRDVGPRQPAVELVDEAEVANDVPEVADLSLVEVRQVDAGAEEAFSGVARMRDLAAAQHADLGPRVEERDVDGDLERLERRLVLGIQEAGIVHCHHHSASLALHACAREIEPAPPLEFGEARSRMRMRQQHRVAKMAARHGIGEHGGKEEPLVDFEAALVLLQPRCFFRECGVARQQVRKGGRGAPAKLIDAHELPTALRDAVVDVDRVQSQVPFARGAVGAGRRGRKGHASERSSPRRRGPSLQN